MALAVTQTIGRDTTSADAPAMQIIAIVLGRVAVHVWAHVSVKEAMQLHIQFVYLPLWVEAQMGCVCVCLCVVPCLIVCVIMHP